jgi:two-component system chemotaxis sensor kinase CheA
VTPAEQDALLRTFLAETEEGLARMEDRILALEEDPETPEAAAEIFRIVHTLKGNAGIFGFSSLATLGHALEDVLEGLRAGDAAVGPDLVALLLEGLDAARRLVSEAVAGRDRLDEADEALLAKLAASAAVAVGAREAPAGPGSGPEAGPEAGPSGPSRRASPRPLETRDRTLRVEMEKLDRLVDVAGEIGVGRGRVVQLLEDPAVSKQVVLQALREADYLHMELQELAMKLRTVPVSVGLRRHRRTVRDMAVGLGKEARLVLEGEEVELDISVVEHLQDPLTHMLRNAVGHGIEAPEERRAAGKDPVGRVTVRTLAESGSIVLQVADDGRGLDLERILRRARATGRIGERETPSDARLADLVFEPGFSTVEAVSELSGRGVGMDVVRRNVEALQGSVRVASRPGEGTTFTLRMPLTLAVIDGFMVEAADEMYVLPLESVVETLGLPAGLDLDRDGERNGSGVASLRGQNLGCVRLRRVLGLDEMPAGRESVVVIHYAGRELGLVVDALHGEQQTVLKPVPKLLRGLPGIAGSAILGNGRVALILDVAQLLESHQRGSRAPGPAPARHPDGRSADARPSPLELDRS